METQHRIFTRDGHRLLPSLWTWALGRDLPMHQPLAPANCFHWGLLMVHRPSPVYIQNICSYTEHSFRWCRCYRDVH